MGRMNNRELNRRARAAFETNAVGDGCYSSIARRTEVLERTRRMEGNRGTILGPAVRSRDAVSPFCPFVKIERLKGDGPFRI